MRNLIRALVATTLFAAVLVALPLSEQSVGAAPAQLENETSVADGGDGAAGEQASNDVSGTTVVTCSATGSDGDITLTWDVDNDVTVNLRGDDRWIATYTGPGSHSVEGAVETTYIARVRAGGITTDYPCTLEATPPPTPNPVVACTAAVAVDSLGTNLSWTAPDGRSVNIRVDGGWIATRSGSGSENFPAVQPNADWTIRTRLQATLTTTTCVGPDNDDDQGDGDVEPPPENGCIISGTWVDTKLPQIECDALVALYDATDGPGWRTSFGWLTPTDPCDWYGITCAGSSVTLMILSSNQLSGSPPPQLGDLAQLRELDVGGNALTSLPAEIGDLRNLLILRLSNNELTSLPPEIGNFENLVLLYASLNQLSTLPAEIGNFTKLRFLELGDNQITSLPPEIGNLISLERLILNDNRISSLPPEIGDLTAVRDLGLAGNELESLPASIGKLGNLMELDVSGNQLTWLPDEIGDLTRIVVVFVRDNKLTSLPVSIGDPSSLRFVNFRNNRLTGDMTDVLAGLTDSVIRLWLSDGAGGNDCVSVTDPDVENWLDANSPGWDECDNP